MPQPSASSVTCHVWGNSQEAVSRRAARPAFVTRFRFADALAPGLDLAGAGLALRGVRRASLQYGQIFISGEGSSLMSVREICHTTNAITRNAMIALMNAP
jgi:hypothetical protein